MEVGQAGKVTAKSLLKQGMAAEDRQEVSHAWKVTDIGKGQTRSLSWPKKKDHVVSHVVCLTLVIFSTCRTSWNQLTTNTEVPLYLYMNCNPFAITSEKVAEDFVDSLSAWTLRAKTKVV